MLVYTIGKTYNAILNGQARTFEVLEEGEGVREGEYAIRWDDGEEEWAYPLDLERWTDEWKVEHVFKPVNPKGYNQLTDRQRDLFDQVYSRHYASMGTEKRQNYTRGDIKEIKWDSRENCLRVYFLNGEWFHYDTKGEWY